jgi:CheY-like chemotaxis protein
MSLPDHPLHSDHRALDNVGATPSPATASNAPAATPIPAGVRRAKVLVIDDDPAILRVVQRALGGAHEVTVLTRPVDALALVAEDASWDLVLCDMHMPEMDGVELHAAFKALSPRLANALVFLSGGSAEPVARRSLANPWMSKPFDLRALRELARSRAR